MIKPSPELGRLAGRAVDAPLGPARYARMFPELPSLDVDDSFLLALGCEGGVCDRASPRGAPETLGDVAAGWPIFGQFVGHDITADRSPLARHIDPSTLRNARAPVLDLQCLYGDGPIGHPYLYRRDDPARLLLGSGDADLPRNVEGIAIIGDPRHDSHTLIAQMHLAMMRAHNGFVDDARRAGVPDAGVFERAVREMRWHYEWAILHDFLPMLVDAAIVDDVLTNGTKWFRPDEIFIPLEFADAAYRYGHSQIRRSYQLNRETAPVLLFPDLLGFQPVPAERQVDWTLFFDAEGEAPAQRAKRIDGTLPHPLIDLPTAMTGKGEPEEYHSLAMRDLRRGYGVGLPSGEALAAHVGENPLSADEVGLSSIGWKGETPLWYYLLRESAVRGGGNRLGPLGGRIVTEVLVTLLDRDATSVRFAEAWKPKWSLVELLTRTNGGPNT